MSSSPLRVGFDVTPVISGQTGIARYVTEIGSAIEQRGVQLARFAIGRQTFPPPPGTMHLSVPARLMERWWQTFPWPRVERWVGDVDVVHATGPVMPSTARPIVVTVHDVAALRYPELHPARHVSQQRAQLAALNRASVIVTVSATTAQDLAQLGIAGERIVVAPLGVSRLAKPLPSTQAPAPGYLLTVGESSPRKGYSVVLKALSMLDPGVRLVMAGPSAGDAEALRSLIATLQLSERITTLGAVSEPVLGGLYRGALALCFPSIAEGFGLPVLEAMAAGVPVIAADIPAIRELAGDAVLYPARRDEQAWAEAIEAVALDPELRERIAARGRERAATFSWDRTAEATLRAYRLALELNTA